MHRISLVVATWGGYSPVTVHGLLTAVASPVVDHRLWGVQASVVVGHRLCSCSSQALECPGSTAVVLGLSDSAAREIFQDQGWNPGPLHWQADS